MTIPWFALGFLAIVLFNSFHLLPVSWVIILQQADQFLLTMAMTALGMETSLQQLKGVGIKPFILAGFLFFWLLIGGYASVYMLTG